MHRTATISVDAVQLALVSRRIAAHQRRSDPSAGCRWAAMSAHLLDVGRCRQNRYAYRPVAVGSMLTPLSRGHLAISIERMRLTEGLPAIRKTFGCGLRAILAETGSAVMR